MRGAVAFLLTVLLSGSAPAQDVDEDYVLIPRALVRQVAEQNIALRFKVQSVEDERDVALKDVQLCQSARGT